MHWQRHPPPNISDPAGVLFTPHAPQQGLHFGDSLPGLQLVVLRGVGPQPRQQRDPAQTASRWPMAQLRRAASSDSYRGAHCIARRLITRALDGCLVEGFSRCRARAAPALAVRVRLPRSGKSSRLILSLRSPARRVRDALGRQTSGALMRRWSLEVYADHTDRTRREESPRRFSCSAAHGPLQTDAAVQHRHGAGGAAPSEFQALRGRGARILAPEPERRRRVTRLRQGFGAQAAGRGRPSSTPARTRRALGTPAPATGPAAGAEASHEGRIRT
jgi:hypothetical protein